MSRKNKETRHEKEDAEDNDFKEDNKRNAEAVAAHAHAKPAAQRHREDSRQVLLEDKRNSQLDSQVPGGQVMNEEIEKALGSVQKTIEAWDESHTVEIASQLQMQLTMLKLLIGIDRFDELPAFVRYLREATRFIDNKDKQKEKPL